MEALPSDQILSPSTRRALRRAQAAAILRARATAPAAESAQYPPASGDVGSAVPAPVVDEDDLLVALTIAHGGDNAVVDLLDHYRIDPGAVVPIDRFAEYGHHAVASDARSALRDATNALPKLFDDVEIRSEWPGPDPPFGPGPAAILDAASRLVQRNRPDEEGRRWLRLRDVFGGMLLVPGSVRERIAKAVSSAGGSFEEVAASFPVFLGEHYNYPYRDFLEKGRLDERPEGELPDAGRLLRPDFAADAVPRRDLLKDDRLNIAPHVEALALLITAKDMKPPLAVGLFGDWGSGKSYFMEALREEIERITAEARRSGLTQFELPVYRNVAHVRFNAWHYVDANLWASLVDTVFASLRIDEGERDDKVAARRQFYVEQLKEQRAALRQADTERRHLEERVELEERRLEQIRRETARNLTVLETAKAAAAVDSATRDAINDLAARAGLPEISRSATELESALHEASEVIRRSGALANAVSGRYGRWWFAGVLATLVGLPVAVALVVSQLDWDAVERLVGVAAGAVGATAGTIRAATARGRAVLERAEQLDAQLQQQIEQSKPVRDARAALAAAQQERAAAEERVDGLMENIREIEEALEGLTPASLLAEFIQGRIGSDDYRKHLGLASLIRRDFEALAGHVKQYNEFLGEKPAEGKASVPVAGGDQAQYHVNRIVMYIDDLDRCPPAQVVEVLQAVHLLLAFELFVVVVAVDARWLAQSLRAHYEDLLAGGRDGQDLASEYARVAGPHDYLEKIFQVPFWLRPMGSTAQSRLLTSLAGAVPAPAGADESAAEASRVSAPEPGPSGEPSAGETPAPSGPVGQEGEPAPPPYDFHPERIEIDGDERAFMEELRPILGRSPRSVKRFVNVYRLVKAVAANTGATFEAGSAIPESRVALWLLAVVTGMPEISAPVFRALRRGSLEPGPSPLGDALREAAAADGYPPPSEVRPAPDAPQRHGAQWQRVFDWVEAQPEWMNADVDGWSVLIERIARYSYRIED